MSRQIWKYEELVRFLEVKDAEVVFWAVDRLIRHFPERCCDAIAHQLLEVHDATPGLIAVHLGEHGDARHHAILSKGFHIRADASAGLCFQALARQGYAALPDLARSALGRRELSEAALSMIVQTLAESGSAEAKDLIRKLVDKHGDLQADPQAMRAVLSVVDPDALPQIVTNFFRVLPPKGTHKADEAFRVWMDALQIDDTAWCFRTGPSGRIEFRKTIKAIESNYDCDVQEAMGDRTMKRLQQRFRQGGVEEIVPALAEWTTERLHAISSDPGHDPEDRLAGRIAAAVHALSTPELIAEIDRLGNPFRQWLIGFHLSTAVAAARYRNVELQLARARGNLDRLLELAEVETAFLLPELPRAVAILCKDDPARDRRAQEWCLRMLESHGPFFPIVVALETLGELKAVPFVPEILDYLSDENSYVYRGAERALAKMGEEIVEPARKRLESGSVPGDAAHSLLVLLCDLGTFAAYGLVAEHLDWFMEEVGPGVTTEWVSLFGHADLIEPLRDWLETDPAMVGQGLLLLGAIHGVPIPEESEILEAIEDERQRREKADAGETAPADDGGWVM